MEIKVEIKAIYKTTEFPLKAVANVILDDAFIIRNVKVIEINDRRFVSMPSVKNNKGEYRNACHPLNREFNKRLETAVIEAYITA